MEARIGEGVAAIAGNSSAQHDLPSILLRRLNPLNHRPQGDCVPHGIPRSLQATKSWSGCRKRLERRSARRLLGHQEPIGHWSQTTRGRREVDVRTDVLGERGLVSRLRELQSLCCHRPSPLLPLFSVLYVQAREGLPAVWRNSRGTQTLLLPFVRRVFQQLALRVLGGTLTECACCPHPTKNAGARCSFRLGSDLPCCFWINLLRYSCGDNLSCR